MRDPFETLGASRCATQAEIHKAYLALARKWHPDRFAQGPEKLWAEEKMIEVNLAYEAALRGQVGEEADHLSSARKLLAVGRLSDARRALMGAETRCAEWNYLFGAVLFRLGETEKAALYFGVASRQRPENALYKAALSSATAIRQAKRPISLLRRIKIRVGRLAIPGSQ